MKSTYRSIPAAQWLPSGCCAAELKYVSFIPRGKSLRHSSDRSTGVTAAADAAAAVRRNSLRFITESPSRAPRTPCAPVQIDPKHDYARDPNAIRDGLGPA